MSIEAWVLLATSLVGLYLLGLIFYRVALAAKRLNNEVSKAKSLIEDLNSAETLETQKLSPSSASELPDLYRARRKRQRQKEEQVKARRRRLIKRISEIEIDKR